ncbi:MAG: HAD-IB family hydrolase [Desulfobacter sp.]|nr:MAG: HAD-IB family hydrolase [Desulfobacter sp.]
MAASALGCSAAFFDVDHTLIRGDTQALEFRRYPAGKRGSPRYIRELGRVAAGWAAFQAGRISLTRQNEIYLTTYRGRTAEALSRSGRVLYEETVSSRFIAGALGLLHYHRRRGDFIIFVSASTPHLLAPLAGALNPDYLFCTELEFDSRGRATGRSAGGICAEEKKAEIVRAFVSDKGIDPGVCHAYSDHHSDIPLLSCLGRPAAVNPTPELAAHARQMGWPVYRFR